LAKGWPARGLRLDAHDKRREPRLFLSSAGSRRRDTWPIAVCRWSTSRACC